MRSRSKITILVLAGIVGAIACAVVRLSAPAAGIVGVGLQSYTNARAIFTVTNLTRYQIQYFPNVERNVGRGWTDFGGPVLTAQALGLGVLRPKEVWSLTVPVSGPELDR